MKIVMVGINISMTRIVAVIKLIFRQGDDFIMGPRLSSGATKWSSCSKRFQIFWKLNLSPTIETWFFRSIARFLDLHGGCLRDSPQQRRKASKGLPGHRQYMKQDTGHRTQDIGHRTQDTRHRTQDTGHRTRDAAVSQRTEDKGHGT